MSMTALTLDLWQVTVLFTMIAGAMWALMRNLLAAQLEHIDSRLKTQDTTRESNHAALAFRLANLEQINRDEAAQWQRLEREILLLQAEMAMHYVRREDYIRGQSVLEAKMDGLATKIENAQLRMVMKGVGP